MKLYQLHSKQALPISRHEAWQFLSDPANLKVITPNFSNITKTVLDTVIAKSLFSKKLSSGDYEWSIIGKNSEYQTQETRSSFTIN